MKKQEVYTKESNSEGIRGDRKYGSAATLNEMTLRDLVCPKSIDSDGKRRDHAFFVGSILG